MKNKKFPKDWHGPMKACARALKEMGVKTTWNSQLVQQMMLWGIQYLLFDKAKSDYKNRPKSKGKLGF